MERKHNTELTNNARALRKNMTKEEKHLWYEFLKTYPVRFLRQKVIDNYIVDFYCHSARKESLRQPTADTSRKSPSQLR